MHAAGVCVALPMSRLSPYRVSQVSGWGNACRSVRQTSAVIAIHYAPGSYSVRSICTGPAFLLGLVVARHELVFVAREMIMCSNS